MSTVEEITAAIARLPEDQISRVRAWLEDFAERRWDEQIEQDERAGRLDAMIAGGPGSRTGAAKPRETLARSGDHWIGRSSSKGSCRCAVPVREPGATAC